MPTIIFVQHDGSELRVLAEPGQSVMQVALNHQVPGILGDCGGNCSCATCHGYVDKSWRLRMPAAQSFEHDLLSCALEATQDSRLTCQIIVTAEMEGLTIRLPAAQY